MKKSRSWFPLKDFTGRLALAILSLAVMVSPACSQEAPQSPRTVSQNLSPENLQELLAPIALYPDALIALILPASTVPSDVVLASRFVANNGDPQQIPNQPWDDSVQSLASYPEVITWMDQNLEWTSSVGQAFIVQPADVMTAIQQLRVQADTAGNLVTTPQQVIVREKTIIRIVPAEPEYLYVPRYDPEIVYVQPYSPNLGPLLTFGVGFAVGSWLNYDFDWNRNEIYRGDWQPGWDYDRYGNNGNGGYNNENNSVNNVVNVVNINQNTAQAWQPSSRSRKQVQRQQENFDRAASNIAANAKTTADVGARTAKQNRRELQNVPKPTRAEFGKRGTGKRSPDALVRDSAAVTSQTEAKTTTGLNPTSPPDVAGQKGKALRKADKAEKPNGKKSDRKSVTSNPVDSTPTADSSKNSQRAGKTSTTDRMPQTTQAPTVDKKGNIKPAKSTSGEKGNKAPRPVSPPSAKNQNHKDANSKPKTSAPQKSQKSQAKTSQAPTKSKTESKQQKSAPDQKSQSKKSKQQSAQQQKPQQQKQQKPQKEQKQKTSSGGNKQDKKASSGSKKSAQSEKASTEKKSDKKKDDKKDKKD